MLCVPGEPGILCRYIVLSPASSDQVTLLNTSAADCQKHELTAYSDLCSQFTTKEVCLSSDHDGQPVAPCYIRSSHSLEGLPKGPDSAVASHNVGAN